MTDAHVMIIISCVGGAGAAAITALFTSLKNNLKALETRADESDQKHEECLMDRNKLAMDISKITGNTALLERCPGGTESTCPYWSDERKAKSQTSRIFLPPPRQQQAAANG